MMIITVIIVIGYLLACLVPFVKPASFLPIALAGLAFPALFVVYLLLLLYWFFKWKKLTIILGFLFLLGLQQFSVVLGLHFFEPKFNTEKKEGVIRVLNWNVFRWDEQNKNAKGGMSNRMHMMDVIQMQDADILCLQEFFEPFGHTKYESNLKELEKRGYPYQYFYPSASLAGGKYQFGMAILSRYPIIKADTIAFIGGDHSEGVLWTDIKVNNDTVRTYVFHLESFRLGKQTFFYINANAGTWTNTKGNVSKLKNVYAYRQQQADVFSRAIESSPHPVVLCGNLGDVPTSNTYFTVKNKLNDSFLERSAGFGRTFRFVLPTARVDYVFTDKRFLLDQFYMPDIAYSDHFPQVVDIKLK